MNLASQQCGLGAALLPGCLLGSWEAAPGRESVVHVEDPDGVRTLASAGSCSGYHSYMGRALSPSVTLFSNK